MCISLLQHRIACNSDMESSAVLPTVVVPTEKCTKSLSLGDLDNSQEGQYMPTIAHSFWHAETRELLILFQGIWWPNTFTSLALQSQASCKGAAISARMAFVPLASPICTTRSCGWMVRSGLSWLKSSTAPFFTSATVGPWAPEVSSSSAKGLGLLVSHVESIGTS